MTSRENDILGKTIARIFKQEGLSIEYKVNKKVVEFLDVQLNLNTELFKIYKKEENNTPVYVHTKSNHPPSIPKNIPAGVNKRLSAISANEEVFKEEISDYQDALTLSGYSHTLKFDPLSTQNCGKRNRSRRITYFNPPFSLNVSTNVGAKFLKLIDKCFPPPTHYQKS